MQLRPDTAKAMSLVQHLLHNVVEKTESAKSKHSHIPSPAFSLLWPRGSPHRPRVRRRKPYPAAGTSKEAKMQKLQVVLGECFSRLEGSHCEGEWCGKFKQQLQI